MYAQIIYDVAKAINEHRHPEVHQRPIWRRSGADHYWKVPRVIRAKRPRPQARSRAA